MAAARSRRIPHRARGTVSRRTSIAVAVAGSCGGLIGATMMARPSARAASSSKFSQSAWSHEGSARNRRAAHRPDAWRVPWHSEIQRYYRAENSGALHDCTTSLASGAKRGGQVVTWSKIPETPRLAWGLGDRYAPVRWSASRSGGQVVRRSGAARRARGGGWTNQPTRSQTARHGPPGRERVADFGVSLAL